MRILLAFMLMCVLSPSFALSSDDTLFKDLKYGMTQQEIADAIPRKLYVDGKYIADEGVEFLGMIWDGLYECNGELLLTKVCLIKRDPTLDDYKTALPLILKSGFTPVAASVESKSIDLVRARMRGDDLEKEFLSIFKDAAGKSVSIFLFPESAVTQKNNSITNLESLVLFSPENSRLIEICFDEDDNGELSDFNITFSMPIKNRMRAREAVERF